MPFYFFSSRAVDDTGAFTNDPADPGETRFLRVPDDAAAPLPVHSMARDDWLREVQAAALATAVPRVATGTLQGDVLVFIHGFNNSPAIVLQRHRILQDALATAGWHGLVVSYDWPSAQTALNYLDDRVDALTTAQVLVEDGVRLLAAAQVKGCAVGVHLLAHSTGAYVVREAFAWARKRQSAVFENYGVGQCVFIAADVSRASLGDSDAAPELYERCVRFTNYSNGADEVLQISNYKRLGLLPRAGRVGLPDGSPANALNVDCTAFWTQLNAAHVSTGAFDTFCHSWWFEAGNNANGRFITDLAETLHGGLDRTAIPGRTQIAPNRFVLG